MATIFTQIIQKKIPAFIVAEDEEHLAFLDINPLKKGHTLVIPKKEIDYIFDLQNEDLAKLHIFAKKTAEAIQKSIACERVGVAVVGLEVPHAHIHLVPIEKVSDMNFSNPKLKLSKEDFENIAETIRKNFEN